MSNGIDLITLALARKGGGVTPEELTEALATKQNKLTEGENITIENNVISSNQATAPNPNKLTFTSGKGTEAYDGSLPKMITLDKLNGATKDFVNSSIATNTAFFKGTFDSTDDLPTTDVTNNDYAFVVGTDAAGNTTYTRYKYNADDEGWIEEYVLNNSSFTADQWATIQSGITLADKTQIATNTSAIADIVANMPDSPEDVNAQPVALTIAARLNDAFGVDITDDRYIESGDVKYGELFADSLVAFTSGTDVVLRISVGGDTVVDLIANCYNGEDIIFEGHNMASVLIVLMTADEVELNSIYNIEPVDNIENADDGDLTTAGAQKDYFQTKITSSNMIPYSNISGTPTLATVATSGAYSDLSGKPSLATVATSGSYNDLSNKPSLKTVATSGSYNDLTNKPTIPTVPSNLVLGYSGTTSTASTLKIVTCTQAQYDSSSKSADTIYLING